MTWIEALLLGLLQGLTEFLPVSSSGHLEIGKALLGIQVKDSLVFTVVVHGATVLSTIVVFYKEIYALIKGFFRFRWNDETQYLTKIAISLIPIAIVGLFFKDQVETLFDGNLTFVGAMLLLTAAILALTYSRKFNTRAIGFLDAFVIGIAQAAAVVPGLSRSGSTIATGLLLGNKRDDVARFSFLMVLIPIIGANMKDLADGQMLSNEAIGWVPLLVGFLAAFIAGMMAIRWMLGIVRKGKLIYFALYCFIVGMLAIILS
ncbi:MAG: undecaprenyl-diphosphate phosphatase [Clostridia bacterium]|nr:undecaprenyl-diphosphate phosphatase [Clostridia bacterium]